MPIELKHLLPQVGTAGIHKSGFLFGCGTSKDAGYPLTAELTKKVISMLAPESKQHLEDLLGKANLPYDPASGTPDIEVICDEIVRSVESAPSNELRDLEFRIRELIIEVLHDAFGRHDLTLHVRFFEALRRYLGSGPGPVWIFTTNYDVLFELAACEARVSLETGFNGAIRRFFDFSSLSREEGNLSRDRKFRTHPRVILIKLHGSMSWIREGSQTYETALGTIPDKLERSLILPRRRKVAETLGSPYDNLFTYAHDVLGGRCKYLVTCGFGFRDQHINDRVLTPKLGSSTLRLTALYGDDPVNLNEIGRNPGFNFLAAGESRLDGVITNNPSDLWRFEKLVELLEK